MEWILAAMVAKRKGESVEKDFHTKTALMAASLTVRCGDQWSSFYPFDLVGSRRGVEPV